MATPCRDYVVCIRTMEQFVYSHWFILIYQQMCVAILENID